MRKWMLAYKRHRLPRGASDKEPTAKAGYIKDVSSIPGLGRSPGAVNSMDRGQPGSL